MPWTALDPRERSAWDGGASTWDAGTSPWDGAAAAWSPAAAGSGAWTPLRPGASWSDGTVWSDAVWDTVDIWSRVA